MGTGMIILGTVAVVGVVAIVAVVFGRGFRGSCESGRLTIEAAGDGRRDAGHEGKTNSERALDGQEEGWLR